MCREVTPKAGEDDLSTGFAKFSEEVRVSSRDVLGGRTSDELLAIPGARVEGVSTMAKEDSGRVDLATLGGIATCVFSEPLIDKAFTEVCRVLANILFADNSVVLESAAGACERVETADAELRRLAGSTGSPILIWLERDEVGKITPVDGALAWVPGTMDASPFDPPDVSAASGVVLTNDALGRGSAIESPLDIISEDPPCEGALAEGLTAVEGIFCDIAFVGGAFDERSLNENVIDADTLEDCAVDKRVADETAESVRDDTTDGEADTATHDVVSLRIWILCQLPL